MLTAVSSEQSFDLYRAEQVRELDRRAIQEQGIPGYTLMCRAGEAAFLALRQHWPGARHIVVVCGGGNNGGDGYVIARLAGEYGLSATVLALSDPANLGGDAKRAYSDAVTAGIEVSNFESAKLSGAEIIVDAIFGTGLQRPVSGHWLSAIEAINQHSAGVLAVDVPSGLNADTGAVLGAAVDAAVTVSFIGLKPGLFTASGPDYCGVLLFDDLAVPAPIYSKLVPACWHFGADLLLHWLPPRRASTHKGHCGHVLVVGGNHGMAGAARMAGEAAARCGAGLISVATRPEHAGLQAAVRPELMFRGVASAAELQALLERATVVAIGPGLGMDQWARELLDTVLAYDLPLVVDADALNLLAQRTLKRETWVLTPHPGEAGKLLHCSSSEVQADRFAAAAKLVECYGGIAVLKGAGSLIADQEESPALCNTGNPGMASGGMGDVLSGVIAALIAQGLSLSDAARSGVYLHGRAGDLAAAEGGQRGLLATDLLPQLRRLVNPG